MGSASIIAGAVALIALLAYLAWRFSRAENAGRSEAERDVLRDTQEHQDEASEILTEPAPTGWREILARRAARRKRRLRHGGAG